MKSNRQLSFPISFEESLSALQLQLKVALKKCFKSAGLRLSPHGYISIQVFEFPFEQLPVVKYLSTDQYRLYAESSRKIKIVISALTKVGSRPLEVLRESVEQIIGITHKDLTHVYADLTGKESNEFQQVVAKLRHKINETLPRNLSVRPSPEQVATVLKACLQELEQPLTTGLAREVYDSPQHEGDLRTPTFMSHITSDQERSLRNSAAPPRDNEVYKLISNIEKYFFIGGIEGATGERAHTASASFGGFMPLYCYGQRAGYLFIIESYATNDERDRKIDETRKFINSQAPYCENYLKEIKEGNFLHEIGGDILTSGDYSEESFFKSINKNIGIVVNQLKVAFEPQQRDNPKTRDLRVRKQGNLLKIPISIKEDDYSKYLGQLKILLAKPDADALWQPPNRMALLRTLSNGLEFIKLNRRIQEKERDARWKDIFRKLWHNTQFHLAGAFHVSKELEGLVAKLAPDVPHLKPTEYLHDLRYLLELSRYVDEPSAYVNDRDAGTRRLSPDAVNLSAIVTEVIDYIELEVLHNNSRALRLGHKDIRRALLEAARERRLFHTRLDSESHIESYREVIGVIIKDILVNATAHAIDLTGLNSGRVPSVLVELSKPPAGSGYTLIVRNESGIKREAYSIWMTGKIPEDSALHSPLGILICRNFLNWMGYDFTIPAECIKEDGGSFTQISINFPTEPLEYAHWKEKEYGEKAESLAG